MTPPQELSISSVLGDMKELAETHRPVLVPVTLLFAVLNAALVAVQLAGTLGMALSLGLSLLLGAAYAGMLAALVFTAPGEKTGGDLWAAIRPVLSSLIWVTLLVAICAGVGMLALFVPGLYLLTIWAVVVPVIVNERIGVTASLARSRDLVRGNGWRVFGFLICLGMITLLFGLLGLIVALPFGNGVIGLMVGNFIVACVALPVLSGGPAVLYRALAPAPGSSPAEGGPEESPFG